jgi:hypothetical protein
LGAELEHRWQVHHTQQPAAQQPLTTLSATAPKCTPRPGAWAQDAAACTAAPHVGQRRGPQQRQPGRTPGTAQPSTSSSGVEGSRGCSAVWLGWRAEHRWWPAPESSTRDGSIGDGRSPPARPEAHSLLRAGCRPARHHMPQQQQQQQQQQQHAGTQFCCSAGRERNAKAARRCMACSGSSSTSPSGSATMLVLFMLLATGAISSGRHAGRTSAATSSSPDEGHACKVQACRAIATDDGAAWCYLAADPTRSE